MQIIKKSPKTLLSLLSLLIRLEEENGYNDKIEIFEDIMLDNINMH